MHRLFPQAIVMSGRAGDFPAAGPIGLDDKPAVNLIGIDRAAIERHGLAPKVLSPEEAARLEVIIPPRFGTHPTERDAAKQFMQLFAREK